MNTNRSDWSKKLDNTLWAYRTAFKIPVGMSTYYFVFCKSCYLPIELEYNVLW